MIYQYIVTLRNEKGRYIDVVSQLLAAISAVFFLAQQIKSGARSFIFLAAFVLITAGLAWNLYRRSRSRKPVFYSRILLVAAVAWFAMPAALAWIGLPLLLLALLEKQAKLPLEIGFTDNRVVFNTLFERKVLWQSLSNVVLKDGMLTLDFKNNKLFQKQTIDDDDDADEDEFNAYCKLRLADSKGQATRKNE